jgi:hypothetical protein
MQKREDPDESLVRMDRGIGGPAAKQLAPPVDGERSAENSFGLLPGQAAARVDQHETAGTGEPEN